MNHITNTFEIKKGTTKCWALCQSDDEKILAQSLDLRKRRSGHGMLMYTVI